MKFGDLQLKFTEVSRIALAEGGYSLIELLVAIAIVGILLGVALPTYINIINRVQIDQLTQEILQYLREVQWKAILEQHSYITEFNQTEQALKLRYYRVSYPPGGWKTLYPQIRSNQLAFEIPDATDDTLIFTPHGNIETPVRIYLGMVNDPNMLRCLDVRNGEMAESYYWIGKRDECMALPPWWED